MALLKSCCHFVEQVGLNTMTRKQLIVSSNRDSGAGSLRQALAETQKRDGGQFDIVFRSNAQPNNKLTTGFFTIALESPLPVIYRNDGSDRYSRLKFPSLLLDDFDLNSLNDSSHLDAPGLVGIASHLV